MHKNANVILDSGNDLSPVRRQAITRTNADYLSSTPQETDLSVVLIKKVREILFKNMHLKITSAKYQPFWPCLNVKPLVKVVAVRRFLSVG